MRDKYVEDLIKEVIGPRNGSEEIIVGADPYTEYVTGVIIPLKCKKTEKSPDSEIIVSEGDDSESDEGISQAEISPALPSELDPRMKPKSFGISFLLKGENPVLKVCVTWGRYKKEIIIPEKNDFTGTKVSKGSWKRQPFKKIVNLSLSNGGPDEEIVYSESDGKIILNIRKIRRDNNLHVILSLINDLNIEECSGDKIVEAAIYQPSLRVILSKGCHLESIESIKNDKLDFIYRENPVLARGHMCSAIWKDVDYQNLFETGIMWPDGNYFSDCQEFIECDVRSEFVSLYPSPAPVFDWDDSISAVAPEFSALNLSEMWGHEKIDSYLSPLTKAYEQWIINNEKSQNSFSDKERELVTKLIQHQRMSLERLNSGIQYIKDNEDALLSFCFANKVIWLQNLWKKREKYNYSKEDFRWRPFQLAFFLMNLESLSSCNSKYRNYLDLLWIPTGGGKTEAYLAMMAYVIALRRRNAKKYLSDKEIDSSGAGTAIITRYTLRLLTVQQFRRTLIMITAAEYLRVFNSDGLIGWRPEKCQILDNWLYGSVRFSVGMWVGGSVSPNHLRGDHSAIKALRECVSEGEPAQIIKCPVCGAWLAVPRAGLSEGANPFYMTVKSTFSVDDLKQARSSIQYPDFIKDIDFIDRGHLPNHLTLSLKLESNRKIDERELDDQISKIVKALGVEGVSFRPSRPGYFPSYPEPGRKSDTPVDFEIFCPNPECDLNNGVNHKEGVPLNLPGSKGEQLSDGLFIKENLMAFLPGSRIPIPAYTVDEQIYHRCPTVIVSTADKIARLAFEPRAASIFGNITNYNAIYGYYRENLLPKNSTITASSGQYSVNVRSFHPPEMIVQDELHLMDGPLGSMFGLYECIVDGLIHESGGNPKYIASSATVNKAENQVESLFKRPLFQFPAYGLTFKDSFFVRMPDWSTGWDESRPGRIYMGIYAPGRGPLTPIIRLWSRILNTGEENRSEKDIINFWTLVGYFNSLRELGGNRALYREDIIERLSNISKISPRNLDAERVVELSSRIDSTDIPQILEELEQGQSRLINENPDAIFTTSMFGTGVDIPHLSLMVVNGQPKTTSQYIQATGRVGRSHGALVITFYKAGRPRDLSHYEIFTGYHHRINLEVEPASVSPFSDGCMAKAAGPGIVSFLRNMHKSKVMWFNESGHNIGNSMARNDFEEFINYCLNNRGVNDADVINKFQSQFDRWLQISQLLGINQNLVYHDFRLF